MLTNRVLSAEEALDWGIVNKVVTKDELSSETMKLAERSSWSVACLRKRKSL